MSTTEKTMKKRVATNTKMLEEARLSISKIPGDKFIRQRRGSTHALITETDYCSEEEYQERLKHPEFKNDQGEYTPPWQI